MTVRSQSVEAATAKKRRTFRVEVGPRVEDDGANGRTHVRTAHQLGLTELAECRTARLYFLQGDLTTVEVRRLGRELLADPVTEQMRIGQWEAETDNHNLSYLPSAYDRTIEVTLLPGVTDPPAENLIRAGRLLGAAGLERVATGQRYLLAGSFAGPTLQRLATEVFANPVIQRFAVDRLISPPFYPYQAADETVEHILVRDADEEALLAISNQRRLALNLAEMQAIKHYFEGEGRDPTDVELEMLAQTWSEHCVHKTFKAVIDYVGPPPGAAAHSRPVPQTIDGLLDSYIRGATEKVNKPWVRSAFVDNAGIVAFDDRFDLAFKVETHNHPSALEPFGGANTGVGGVVRDVLGVSARPIANTDVLCFGPLDLPPESLPAGVLHPRRIADGVVHGIEDYGNKMGIPTVNGAILYHDGYTANPLVYCGCLGLLPRGSHPTEVQPGDLIVAIGGRTGRDGLRGATFSSMEMDVETSEIAGTAVQIGNPVQEKQVLEVVLQARDEQLYHAITDCGAGGFSSAVGEMAEGMGAQVQLQNVLLKYPGLRPWEIWLSEAQERMVLAVPPQTWARLQEICAGQDVEAVCLGQFEDSGRLCLTYGDQLVGDLSLAFLHEGLPRPRLEATWQPVARGARSGERRAKSVERGVGSAGASDYAEVLLALLAHPNVCSKEDVIRRYDHEVQGGTAVKPLTGRANHGPGDAAVLVPLAGQLARFAEGQQRNGPLPAVALANGICPQYGELDPYAMAWAAVDEAMRNVVAVGADPDRVALLDNFCWGNPNLPDRLGTLVRCAQGCYDAAVAYNVPFVSGKDSLNNEYVGADGRKHAIPGTLLISALGIVPDVGKTITMDLKKPGNVLYLVGRTRAELDGSHYRQVCDRGGVAGDRPPQPVPDAIEHMRALHRATANGLVRSCHDCAEGGLAVALAEMCLAGGWGAEVELADVPGAAEALSDEVLLFSESLSRFVVEVAPSHRAAFEATLAGVPMAHIGQVTESQVLRLIGRDDVPVTASLSDLEQAWRGHLRAGARSPVNGAWSPTTGDPSSVASDRLSLDNDEPAVVAKSERLPSGLAVPNVAGSARVLILHANGTNRDREAALACQLAGGRPEIVHINQLLTGRRRLPDYHMLVIPGGFSYGDDLGAGALWALDLRHRFGRHVRQFVADGRPVLGICNGFQVLVKAGLLPGENAPVEGADGHGQRPLTLTYNKPARFECRWVYLKPNGNSSCLFTQGVDELIYCPVAHGEGRLAVRDDAVTAVLRANNLISLTYADVDGQPVTYPANPNGSVANVAGLCNPAGNVLGLMPHPEDHVFPWQHPRRHRGEGGMMGLHLFENGIKNA